MCKYKYIRNTNNVIYKYCIVIVTENLDICSYLIWNPAYSNLPHWLVMQESMVFNIIDIKPKVICFHTEYEYTLNRIWIIYISVCFSHMLSFDMRWISAQPFKYGLLGAFLECTFQWPFETWSHNGIIRLTKDMVINQWELRWSQGRTPLGNFSCPLGKHLHFKFNYTGWASWAVSH